MVQPVMAEKEIEEVMAEDKLREALAAYAHEAWRGWMQYMSSKVVSSHETVDMNKDGKVGGWLPIGFRDRWARQMSTPYDKLPESEKGSDRAEADKIIAILDDDPRLRHVRAEGAARPLIWKIYEPTFKRWRDQVDSDHALDTFDLALGWFSGLGFGHEDACDAARHISHRDEL